MDGIILHTITIDTYETPEGFVLKLDSYDITIYADLTYDTKEECLADRDKLLYWLSGDNHQIKEFINSSKKSEILELLKKEDIDKYSVSDKIALSKLKNYIRRNDYLFPTVDSLVDFYTPVTFHKLLINQNAAIGRCTIRLLFMILKKNNIIWLS